jgi:gas vesicle protein
MAHQQMHSKEFLVGALLGSLLGGTTALLTASKSGKRLRQDVRDLYDNLTDRTFDLTRRSKCLTKNLRNQAYEWSHRAKSKVGNIAQGMKGFVPEEESEEEEECKVRDFAIGALAGGISGAIAGLLLAPKAGSKFRQELKETCEDVSERTQEVANNVNRTRQAWVKSVRSKADKWLDLAEGVLSQLTGTIEEKGENVREKSENVQDRIHGIIEWVALGARLWKGLKSKQSFK